MTEEQIDQVALAIYRQFIGHGVGTCMEITTSRGKYRETPEDAVQRRWKRLQPAAKERFHREAIAAIETWKAIE